MSAFATPILEKLGCCFDHKHPLLILWIFSWCYCIYCRWWDIQSCDNFILSNKLLQNLYLEFFCRLGNLCPSLLVRLYRHKIYYFFIYIPNHVTHLLPDVLFYYHIVLQVFVSPVSTFVILVAAIKFKKLSVFYFEENMWDYKICK